MTTQHGGPARTGAAAAPTLSPPLELDMTDQPTTDPTSPLTDAQLDEIERMPNADDITALLAEVRRLRAAAPTPVSVPADAVMAVAAAEQAATRGAARRGAKAEALLLRFTAEAHRRKWSYDRGLDDDGVPLKSEAFDALHRLGEEMRIELEKLRRMADEEQPAEFANLYAETGVYTPGCDCDHDGMGVKWHRTDCLWRGGLVAEARQLVAADEEQPAAETDASFFEPGHTYAARAGRPGGRDRLRFRCESVSTDPETGQPRAFGQHGRLRTADGAWIWTPNPRTFDDWRGGAWTDITEQPATVARQDGAAS